LLAALVLYAAAPADRAAAVGSSLERQIDTLTAVLDGWTAFKNTHVKPDGRVVDDANGGISHSESQGYGMLLAVKLGDRPVFDRIWDWTRANLGVREDNLFAWQWTPGEAAGVTDRNNATDGDILIAWALVEAARLWNEPAYLKAARATARDIAALTLAETRYGPTLMPGVTGFSSIDQADGPIVNLSYFVFPAEEALAAAAPEIDWAEVFSAGRAILDDSRTRPIDLPPDWTSLAGAKPAPAEGFDAVFGYNAIRIPLYLAWADGPEGSRLERFRRLRNTAENVGPFVIDIESGAAEEPLEAPGYQAVAALVECALGEPASVPLKMDGQSYYPWTLNLLAAVAQLEVYPECA